MIRTEEDLHVWRARPGVSGVDANHGLVLMGAEHPWVPMVEIQQPQGPGQPFACSLLALPPPV